MTLAERFSRTRAIVVGDGMLDEYIWGEVSRVSPEAPVPVVVVRSRDHRPGGAANVAAGVAALGAHVDFACAIGDDPGGENLRQALERRGIAAAGLLCARRATTIKTRVVAHNQQIVRFDSEDGAPLPAELEASLLAWAARLIDAADVVVLSDYAKGLLTADLTQGLISLSRQAGKPVVVDPKGSDYEKYRGATVITPNLADAHRALHGAVDASPLPSQLARQLGVLVPGSAVLLTRGSEGMSLFDAEHRVEVPADAQQVYDVTGAGDTVAATLSVALGAGAPLEAAVRLANTAAGIAVSKIGTATVTAVELGSEVPSEWR